MQIIVHSEQTRAMSVQCNRWQAFHKALLRSISHATLQAFQGTTRTLHVESENWQDECSGA